MKISNEEIQALMPKALPLERAILQELTRLRDIAKLAERVVLDISGAEMGRIRSVLHLDMELQRYQKDFPNGAHPV